MAAQQRLAIEQLFGKESYYNRNSYVNTKGRSALYDNKICRSFVVGKCPYDLFSGTKDDMGRCKRIHSENHRMIYEAEKQKYSRYVREQQSLGPGPDMDTDTDTGTAVGAAGGGVEVDAKEMKQISQLIHEYEYEYEKDLEYYLSKVRRKIQNAEANLQHTTEEQEKINKIREDLDKMDARITMATQEINILQSKGKILKAAEESEKLGKLSKERTVMAENIKELTNKVGQASQQQLEVCGICGAYLSRLDSDRRLADHFIGKTHLAYVQMHAELSELKASKKRSRGGV